VRGKAVEPLRSGGAHFAAAGSFYSHALAVCSGNRESEWIHQLNQLDRRLTATDREFVLLRLGWLDSVELDGSIGAHDAHDALLAHMDQAAPAAPVEVGRLRIPLEATIRILRSADRVLRADSPMREVNALAADVHDFLIRVHDVTAEAMNDRLHWERMMSSVLPVEPEAAAAGAVVMAAAGRTQTVGALMDRLALPPQALAPLRVGAEIAGFTRG
jgi:hypothetical protein